MEGPDPGRPRADADAFTVADPEQARLLSDPRFQAAMRPFLAREASASAAAAELGLDLNAMLYRIRLLLAAGLLRVVREEKRQGRPIKVYRSVHDAYFVPYEATPFADLEERLWQQQLPELRELVRLQARLLRQGGRHGQRLFRDASGETWVQSAAAGDERIDWLDPSQPAALDFWTDLALDEAESREVQRRLYELLRTYSLDRRQGAGQGLAGRKRYRLNVAFVPLEE
ncbi:MAG: helix-turn-helix domain-containing protein [Deinococcales bacterium]|nr:helix-turn-helix domain-containing protein [Deinococcales bacterium]